MLPVPFPWTPAKDVSGTVVAVGAQCTRLKVGDAVYADTSVGFGCMAEYVIAPEALVAVKPANIGFVAAASLPLVGLTCIQAFETHGNLKQGAASQTCLILGGGGGIGNFAIQYAKKVCFCFCFCFVFCLCFYFCC
jgi:NADPH:quinone reductase-like Zn-dependent oxidoreductase